MALLDFLKNKEEKDKAKEKKVAVASDAPKPKKKAKVQATEPSVKTEKSKATKGFSYTLVQEPHISEKSNFLGAQNKYTFRVMGNANKPEIKRSIEGIYGVNVVSVNMINVPGKKRRVGRVEGFKKGFAKAIVTIKEGQKIELF
jgi:large subunit ribosomal protein L23